MKKNILLIAMLVLIAVAGIGTFVQKNQTGLASAGSPSTADNEINALEEYAKSPIGLNEYAGIYTLKQILPDEIFRECVLSPLEKLLAKDPVTRADFAVFEREIAENFKKKNYSLKPEIMALAKKESLGSTMKRTLDIFNENAGQMGQDLKQGFEQFLNDFNKQFVEPKDGKTGSSGQATEL